METLPDSLASGAPITVHPVLFNKGTYEHNYCGTCGDNDCIAGDQVWWR